MFKKTTVIAGAGLLALGLGLRRDAVSYVSTTAGLVTNSVKSAVPVEFEIERARNLLASIKPEIRNNMQAIAKEEVEIERLARRMEKLRDRQVRDRAQLVQLKRDIGKGRDTYVYCGRRYNAEQVREDMANRLTRAKTTDATVASLEKVMGTRSRSLNAARMKLEEMLVAKRQLVADIESLEAQNTMVDVAKSTSDFQFDDSQLARTEQLIEDIRTRLQVEERLLDVNFDLRDEIPLVEKSSEDVMKQVAKYLGESDFTENSLAQNEPVDSL